jgi:hypothetical protein
MPTLNESKWNYLFGQVGAPSGTLAELEYRWLASLTGKPSGLTLNEQWHFYLDLQGIPAGSLGQRQYAWLLTTGVTGISDKLTLNENFYLFWNQIGVIIAFPDLTLTAGDNGGSRVGFSLGQYGTVTPQQTMSGDAFTALFCNNSNGRVRLQVLNEYAPDSFTSMEIAGVGTLLSADAIYDYDGTETEYRWDGTGFSLVSGDVYAVNFL